MQTIKRIFYSSLINSTAILLWLLYRIIPLEVIAEPIADKRIPPSGIIAIVYCAVVVCGLSSIMLPYSRISIPANLRIHLKNEIAERFLNLHNLIFFLPSIILIEMVPFLMVKGYRFDILKATIASYLIALLVGYIFLLAGHQDINSYEIEMEM